MVLWPLRRADARAVDGLIRAHTREHRVVLPENAYHAQSGRYELDQVDHLTLDLMVLDGNIPEHPETARANESNAALL
jgi:hypothetical protein